MLPRAIPAATSRSNPPARQSSRNGARPIAAPAKATFASRAQQKTPMRCIRANPAMISKAITATDRQIADAAFPSIFGQMDRIEGVIRAVRAMKKHTANKAITGRRRRRGYPKCRYRWRGRLADDSNPPGINGNAQPSAPIDCRQPGYCPTRSSRWPIDTATTKTHRAPQPDAAITVQPAEQRQGRFNQR